MANELAWSADDAIAVIEWLAHEKARAVVGVELWQNVDNMPKWIASSNYTNGEALSAREYAIACSKDAINFIRQFESRPGALFNLT